MKTIAPYGTWKSPITAAEVASAGSRFSFPDFAGDEVWWSESRPAEGGRTTIVASAGAAGPGGTGPGGTAGAAGPARELLPAPWSARTRVHEYGGKSFLPVPSGSSGPRFDLVFANFADQRLYRLAVGSEASSSSGASPSSGSGSSGAGSEPSPLTPGDAGLRFADLTLSPDKSEIWGVQEAHSAPDGAITRSIVAVPLDGSARSDASRIRTLVTGAGFFAFPAPSPDGTQIAWVNWDHPRMPWDGTELRVGPASGTTVAGSSLLLGGPSESVLAPRWRDSGSLYAVSDRSDWWNLYVVSLSGAAPAPVCPREEEFAGPLWQLGGWPYAVLGDGRLAVTHGTGTQRLSYLDPSSGALTDAGLEYQAYGAVAASGTAIATVAGGSRTPLAVLRLAPGSGPAVLREAAVPAPGADWLPEVRQVALPAGPNGSSVHALVYPPSSPSHQAPAGELPPYIAWIHGGPTGKSSPLLDIEKAYFTSRGIGLIDVNYGGSAGYGRAYRERLRGRWGVVDVADAMNAARALAEASEADPGRLGIRGGSAGGWTALAAVTSGIAPDDGRPAVFSAAVSYYGVAELRGFADSTHDFESRYLDGLIGPLPSASSLYDERSPMGHVTASTCPILLLQGLDDPIVPPSQSEVIASDLAAHGVPYAYIAFEGESHGFRKAETIIRSLESELAFYGQIMGFTPPGVAPVKLEGN